jgi:hypothetical protein
MSGSILSTIIAHFEATGERPALAQSDPEPASAERPRSDVPVEPEPVAEPGADAALSAHPEYAYVPRQGAYSYSHNHAVLDQPLTKGRLKRAKGDALCRVDFWGLYPSNDGPVSCPRCISLAERYGVTLVNPTAGGAR